MPAKRTPREASDGIYAAVEEAVTTILEAERKLKATLDNLTAGQPPYVLRTAEDLVKRELKLSGITIEPKERGPRQPTQEQPAEQERPFGSTDSTGAVRGVA